MQAQTKAILGALALLVSSGALAQTSGQEELQTIANASGLQPIEVRMLLSNSPTAYTTTYLTYDVVARKLRRAVEDGRVHLLPSRNGAYPNFAAWQRIPTRALALVPKQPGLAQATANGN
jgi:hypothetical protein